MNISPHVLFFATLWALAATGLAWYITSIGRNITYVTLADGRRQERRVPLIFRVLMPFTVNFMPIFRRRAFDGPRDKIEGRIIAAGFEGLINAEEYFALQILLPVVAGLFWGAFVWFTARASGFPFMQNLATPLTLLGIGFLWAYPGLWLKKTLQARHRALQRALPFMLDLLTLSVEAGMDFMMALQRAVERRRIDALGEELIRMIREMQLGKTRREALRDMSLRVDLPELRSVVNALVQADELGVSIGTILRIQSDQIRQRRFERAEQLANEAPVKMLFPLMVFIFPAVFLVLLGPIVKRLLEQGF
jgi:tight adherence protein C